ncbi:hypothetical protein ACQCPQ_23650 [Priestia megaterium]|uniref:hypothetical protein n=1 Tax=Priestia megaterium TaxID=1404 RepID=UPI003CFE5DAA
MFFKNFLWLLAAVRAFVFSPKREIHRQIRQQVLLYELQGIVKQEANDEEIHR